jgi:hypothetical protein
MRRQLILQKPFANYEFHDSALCASSTLSAYVFLLLFLLGPLVFAFDRGFTYEK